MKAHLLYIFLACLFSSLISCEKEDTKPGGVINGAQGGLPNSFGNCKIISETEYRMNDSLPEFIKSYSYGNDGKIKSFIVSLPKYPSLDSTIIRYTSNQDQSIYYKIRSRGTQSLDTIQILHFDAAGRLKKIQYISNRMVESEAIFNFGGNGQLSTYSHTVLSSNDRITYSMRWQNNNLIEARVLESAYPNAPVNSKTEFKYDNFTNPYYEKYFIDNPIVIRLFSENNITQITEYNADGSLSGQSPFINSYHANYLISHRRNNAGMDSRVILKYKCD